VRNPIASRSGSGCIIRPIGSGLTRKPWRAGARTTRASRPCTATARPSRCTRARSSSTAPAGSARVGGIGSNDQERVGALASRGHRDRVVPGSPIADGDLERGGQPQPFEEASSGVSCDRAATCSTLQTGSLAAPSRATTTSKDGASVETRSPTASPRPPRRPAVRLERHRRARGTRRSRSSRRRRPERSPRRGRAARGTAPACRSSSSA
jgi:hypothetical protein